jgi:putative zinc finger/helix-turn-helix YgiT family protein
MKMALFEYTCPECGEGTVQTTRIQNYKTKVKGFPFVVDEAIIGICDTCQAEQFAPEEIKRWEELFSHSLEVRKVFLSPSEITDLRKSLGLSMEDFARLIGCTRQSIYNWEKVDRPSPLSRMADLLMKLVRESIYFGTVDVLTFLLEEAKKWGVVIEVRRSRLLLEKQKDGRIILRTKQVRRNALPLSVKDLALAADVTLDEEELIMTETLDGEPVGVLGYDYQMASLILDVTSEFPTLKPVNIEIDTHDGRQFIGRGFAVRKARLLLLEDTKLRPEEVAQITLKGQSEETRD